MLCFLSPVSWKSPGLWCFQFFKNASIDNTIETPIMTTEFVTDPAAPASGPDAGANEGLRSWADTTEAAKTATKKKAKNFIDDAIAKLYTETEKVEN